MKLTILGSGTMMPTKKRYPAAYLLDVGSTRILLDCGHGTLTRLVERGVVFREIEAICVSHFHTDHFSGVLPFAHALWVDNVQTKRQQTPLTIIGPATLEERWKKLREVFWPEPKESLPLTFIEGPGKTTVGTVVIESFPVTHVPWFPSLGFRITADGRTLVYTGDIGSEHPIEDLISRAERADLLLIEAGSTTPAPNHFTIDQVVKLQEKAQTKRIIATHIREQQLPVVRAKLTGRKDILIAEDGLTIDV